MSVRVTCPSCRLVCLVQKEHLGKVIRCPGCRQTFAVRAAEPEKASSMPPLPAKIDPVAAARSQPGRLCAGSATSAGRVRKRNEDSYLVQHMTWASQAGRHEVVMAVVCDGMGGHDAGDRASAVAISVLAAALAPYLAGLVSGEEKRDPEAMLEALDRALWEANRSVARAAEEEPGCAGMGATAVAAIVADDLAAICHVGDCRAYLQRGGKVGQLTKDQTLVARMIELGTLTEQEAARNPAGSQVSQALGKQYDLEPSRLTFEFRPGDRLLLACDGLHAHLDAKAMAGICAGKADPVHLATELVERTDQAGGSDNCTVIVVAAS